MACLAIYNPDFPTSLIIGSYSVKNLGPSHTALLLLADDAPDGFIIDKSVYRRNTLWMRSEIEYYSTTA